MQSDDLYRRAFAAASAQLTAWAALQTDAAAVDCEQSADFCRLRLVPHAGNACPLELMLHRPTQTFDIQIAHETFEARPVPDPATLQPLLDAIIAGRIVTRTMRSASSGALLETAMVVTVDSGQVMSFVAATPLAALASAGEAIARDRHWVAYRRA